MLSTVSLILYILRAKLNVLQFIEALPKFRELGVEVLGASTDSEFTHLAWANVPRNEGGLGPDLKLPLLSDKAHKVSKEYGVLTEDGVTLRGSFLIDPKGVLRQITVNDLPVGRSVDEAIRLIQAFQFTDKHGEVCPADWNPETNNSTINPDNKAEYFSKQQ